MKQEIVIRRDPERMQACLNAVKQKHPKAKGHQLLALTKQLYTEGEQPPIGSLIKE